jgi:hypothetical protein
MTGPWTPVGAYATLAVPAGAKRLLLRANAMSGREYGAYRVVADVVSDAAPAQLGSQSSGAGSAITIGPRGSAVSTQALGVRIASAVTSTGTGVRTAARTALNAVGNGPSTGVIPSGTVPSRSDVHYALRRLGFSDTPAAVTAVSSGGVSAWVATQLAAPAPAADTSIVQGVGGNVEALPVLTGNSMTDGNYSPGIEDRLMQWQVNTKWQLREKITLHWLEHFSVSQATVNQAPDMEHYIETVRADALGNYAKLLGLQPEYATQRDLRPRSHAALFARRQHAEFRRQHRRRPQQPRPTAADLHRARREDDGARAHRIPASITTSDRYVPGLRR